MSKKLILNEYKTNQRAQVTIEAAVPGAYLK